MLNNLQIKEKFKSYIDDGILIKITISSPLSKELEYTKIYLEVKKDRIGDLFFQFTLHFENKVNHENISEKDLCLERLLELFLKGYKQTDIILFGENIKILTNKNREYKLIANKNKVNDTLILHEHDREKNYIIKEGMPINWLVSLGIMGNNGLVVSKYKNKFKQINKFLEVIDSLIDDIPENADIIDVGCGKSYLTFALYYFLNIIKDKKVHITGLDLKKDVISECNRLSKVFEFNNLEFINENIESYKHKSDKVDIVITLHACDTATDYGIYGGIKWGAKIILSVPCCQHELFTQIENTNMKPILKHGILKEKFSSILTDALRAELLEVVGYKTSVMEFIDMEHTPKNIMIKAIKKNTFEFNKSALDGFIIVKEMFNVEPKLYTLINTLDLFRN